jgi:hypothetical protein
MVVYHGKLNAGGAQIQARGRKTGVVDKRSSLIFLKISSI